MATCESEGIYMQVMTAVSAGTNLCNLIEQTQEFHEPIMISGKRGNAVLISEEDWNSISRDFVLEFHSWYERIYP